MKTITVKRAVKIKEKIIGLIGKRNIKPLLLETRFGIHTFGVKYPIDVVILNGQYRVVDTAENLKPNRIFIWNPKYKRVLELPKGTIKELKLKQGQTIQLVKE